MRAECRQLCAAAHGVAGGFGGYGDGQHGPATTWMIDPLFPFYAPSNAAQFDLQQFNVGGVGRQVGRLVEVFE